MTRTYNVGTQKTVEQAYFERVVNSIIKQLDVSADVVEDVSQNSDWFRKDVDILIDGVPYEIKTDTYDTGFCFLETISNSRTGALGWLFASQAKYLVYAFPLKGDAYIADLKKLREYFLDNIYWYIENKQMRKVNTKGGNGYSYSSFGFLVSLETLTEEKVFKKFSLIST